MALTHNFFSWGSQIMKSIPTFSSPISLILSSALRIISLSLLPISSRTSLLRLCTQMLSLFIQISLSHLIYLQVRFSGLDSNVISIFSLNRELLLIISIISFIRSTDNNEGVHHQK